MKLHDPTKSIKQFGKKPKKEEDRNTKTCCTEAK